jgi:hypothetical protein
VFSGEVGAAHLVGGEAGVVLVLGVERLEGEDFLETFVGGGRGEAPQLKAHHCSAKVRIGVLGGFFGEVFPPGEGFVQAACGFEEVAFELKEEEGGVALEGFLGPG